MFGERIALISKRMGINQREMAALLGYHESTLTTWRKRVDKAPDLSSVRQVAGTLQVDMYWLLCETDQFEFGPAVRKAQPALRLRALNDPNLHVEGLCGRFAALWLVWTQLVPEMREDVWARWLHWNPEDWDRCKHGQLEPSTLQIEDCAELTGLPERWLRDGNLACLQEPVMEAYAPAIRILIGKNIDPEDAVRIANQQE